MRLFMAVGPRSIRMHLILLTRGKLDAVEKQIVCQVFALLAGV
jgi:hypothetical protein